MSHMKIALTAHKQVVALKFELAMHPNSRRFLLVQIWLLVLNIAVSEQPFCACLH